MLADVPPAVVGGAEVQALRLAQRWAGVGHDVTIAGPNNFPCVDGRLKVRRIPILRLSRILRGLSYLMSALWLLWSQRHAYDVIYCRFVREQALAASLAKGLFRLRKPLVVCPSCAQSPSGEGSVLGLRRSPVGRVMLALIQRYADRMNAISRVIADELALAGIAPGRTARIPNGTVVPRMDKVQRPCNDAFRILFVGRLTAQKGMDVLLRAFAGLPASDSLGRPVLLDIVGDGDLRRQLEGLAGELDVISRLHFHGSVPVEQVPAFFRRADLFVLPSRYEGMPGVLLEACAHGMPAVATRVSGSEEILVDGAGWLVAPDDMVMLRDALLAALTAEQSALTERGQIARQVVLERYDMDVVALRHVELFEELLKGC